MPFYFGNLNPRDYQGGSLSVTFPRFANVFYRFPWSFHMFFSGVFTVFYRWFFCFPAWFPLFPILDFAHIINPFSFLHCKETSKNQRVSVIFKGYRKRNIGLKWFNNIWFVLLFCCHTFFSLFLNLSRDKVMSLFFHLNWYPDLVAGFIPIPRSKVPGKSQKEKEASISIYFLGNRMRSFNISCAQQMMASPQTQTQLKYLKHNTSICMSLLFKCLRL